MSLLVNGIKVFDDYGVPLREPQSTVYQRYYYFMENNISCSSWENYLEYLLDYIIHFVCTYHRLIETHCTFKLCCTFWTPHPTEFHDSIIDFVQPISIPGSSNISHALTVERILEKVEQNKPLYSLYRTTLRACQPIIMLYEDSLTIDTESYNVSCIGEKLIPHIRCAAVNFDVGIQTRQIKRNFHRLVGDGPDFDSIP